MSVTVTPEMTVDFEELGRVHPVYATYWLAKHMEEAGRKVIVPFLEADEEGIGSALAVRHLAPAFPGTRVEVVAVHARTEGNRIHVSCTATAGARVLGTGTTEQTVLPRRLLAKRLAAAAASEVSA